MKKSIVATLILTLALVFCACGKTTPDNAEQAHNEVQSASEEDVNSADTSIEAEPFDLEAYKEKASDFRINAYAASIILANMGNYENNYWQALGRLDDGMVNKAFSWIAENSDESQETIESNYENIRTAYKGLILTDFGNDTEASEIDAGVRALYSGYSELYSAVTSPSGSREDFASHVSDLISEIQSANKNLLLFLPEESQ